MSLQLHRPDGKGGLEVRTATDEDHRDLLRSPRWGSAMPRGRLSALKNTEMNPTSTPKAVAFWVVLALITFGVIVVGYAGLPFLNLAPLWRF